MSAVPDQVTAADALAAAAELEGQGRGLDAIRVLTEANRAARHDRLEEQLVELRHRAAVASSPEPPGEPPPPITALPTSAGPLPELRPDELDPAALREGMARHGCVLVRGLLDRDRAEGLAAGIDTAFAAFDTATEAGSAAGASPWYRPFTPQEGTYRVGGRRGWVRAGGGLWTTDSPRMLFELTEVIEQTGVGELVTGHLGERPFLSANKCTLRRVPVDSNTSWHQDGAFLGAEIRTVNLWLALSDCGVDAPGLDILPRRVDEVLETGTRGAIFDWSVSDEIVDELAADVPVVRPAFAPGDAMLFDHLLVHRTAVAPGMTRERHAIETWMFTPSGYPGGQIPIAF